MISGRISTTAPVAVCTPFGAVNGLRRWRWPPDQRIEVGALLHAKLLIVDGKRVLVTSGNLTSRALNANIEAGLVVEDEAVASDVERHIRELMRRGVLVPT